MTIKIKFTLCHSSGRQMVLSVSLSRDDGFEWEDRVKMYNYPAVDAICREALGPHEFWMDLKKICYDKPTLLCTAEDESLLRHFYNKYKESAVRPDESWLFGKHVCDQSA